MLGISWHVDDDTPGLLTGFRPFAVKATVICKEKGTLWEPDRETFNNIVKVPFADLGGSDVCGVRGCLCQDAAVGRREALSHFQKEADDVRCSGRS